MAGAAQTARAQESGRLQGGKSHWLRGSIRSELCNESGVFPRWRSHPRPPRWTAEDISSSGPLALFVKARFLRGTLSLGLVAARRGPALWCSGRSCTFPRLPYSPLGSQGQLWPAGGAEAPRVTSGQRRARRPRGVARGARRRSIGQQGNCFPCADLPVRGHPSVTAAQPGPPWLTGRYRQRWCPRPWETPLGRDGCAVLGRRRGLVSLL